MNDYIILDLNKQREKFRSNKPTYTRQGEVDSAPLNVQITLDGKPYDLTGCNVYFEAERADGHKYVEGAQITSAKDGFISHTVPAGLMVAHGVVQLAYFAVYNGDEIITTETMDIVTLPGICMFTDSDTESYIERTIARLESYLSDAGNLTGTVTSLATQATEMLTVVNEALNASETAVTNAQAATSEANFAAAEANAISGNIISIIFAAMAGVSNEYARINAEQSLETLARNSCTSGMYVNGVWYVHSSEIFYRDGNITVSGSHNVDGLLCLPTKRCTAPTIAATVGTLQQEVADMQERLSALDGSSRE